MDRRRFCRLVPAVLAATAGCGNAPAPFDSDGSGARRTGDRTPGDAEDGYADAGVAGEREGGGARTDSGEGVGTDVGPSSLPHRSSDPAANVETPRDVVVGNQVTDRYVTLVVEHRGETVYTDSRQVPAGETVVHEGLVQRRGRYRVIVETAVRGEPDLRTTREWSVREALGDLVVALSSTVRTTQVARCTPDCAPLSRGGEVAPGSIPTGDTEGTLVFQNDGESPRDLRVRVEQDGQRVLSYRYRLPTDVRVVLPLHRDAAAYDVSVFVGGITHSYFWRPVEGQALWLLVDDDVVDFFSRRHARGPVLWR